MKFIGEKMKLNEITADEFKHKLKDPAAYEIHNVADKVLEWAGSEYSFEVHNKGDTNFILFSFDPFSEYFSQFKSSVIERKTFKVIQKIRELFKETNNWVWDTWKADAAGVRCYVVRK